MGGRRRFTRQLAVGGMLAFALTAVSGAGIALAANEPDGSASCIGLELASISPPGSSDEESGGARQFVDEVKELAAVLGVRPGTLFGFIASLHAGSHAECDEALEG